MLRFASLAHPKNQTTTRLVVALCLVSVILMPGCIAPKHTPNLERIFGEARARQGKRPVIVIPGILGTQLINSKTGEVIWPSVLRSSDDGSNLPMTPDLANNRDDVVPGKIIETVQLARLLPEVYVYRDLIAALRDYAGYREGDWKNPAPDGDRDTFYVFPYDFRKDNVENARLLINRLRALKSTLQRPDLRFNILAHSMGGLIARYAAMYGDTDLPTDASQLKPTWAGAADINKIVMLGVPNEGSADAFSTLLEGYSITEGLRTRVPLLNRLTAEESITAPAIFQLLPHEQVVKFLDENLRPMAIDLYDAETWKRYGWSPINDPDYRQRYERREGKVEEAHARARSLQELDRYLAAVLQRAKLFHAALDARSEKTAPVGLFAIGGDCEETLNAPIILRDPKRNRWVTLTRPREYRTASGQRITKRAATEAMYAPGDGRVTRRSLLGEDLAGSGGGAFNVVYAAFGCDLHGALPRNKVLADNALTSLVNEAIK